MKLWAAVKIFWTRLRRLFARPDPAIRRLNRLRSIYQQDVTAGLHTRRVRDMLRGSVAPEYQTHYDRLLRIEQVTADLLRKDVRLALPHLLLHVYSLTERVARLIDQLQRADQLMALYPEGSTEQQMVADARRELLVRMDEAIALQDSIPARLMQISAASTGREFDQARDRLSDLNTRLEGVLESYEQLSNETTRRYVDHMAHHKEDE